MNSSKAKAIIEAFERDHDHSWYEEIYLRNKNTLNDTAIFYRGNCISYKSMFDQMRSLAAAMQSVGVKKGTEIPVCLSNSPELVYVMGAASMLGAKINVFSASFPLDYVKEIIEGCDPCVGFFEDNHFAKIHTAVEATPLERYVLCSLGDSLPATASPHTVEGHSFVCFASSVAEWKEKNSKVTWFYDFLRRDEDHKPQPEKVTLDDEFSVTYTSGSTNALRPKAIIQRVRSFCVIGRFHDADVMHGMKFKNIRGIAIIPPHSNTDLISSISDTLMQGAVLTMEPVYNERFFLDALLLNKPNFVSATCSFWLTAAKQLQLEPQRHGTKLPFLQFAFAVGEELGINEERFLNKTMRRADAGKDVLHLPFSPFCFSVAGGDCEHGSILYRLFRAVMNPALLSSPEKRYGMTPFDFVDIAVLDPEGNRLGPNQTGRLVANSPCTMKCYKNDPSATDKFFIRDRSGSVWGDMSVYGYTDTHGKVYMRNRILQKAEGIPPFKISDEILKERAVLTCVVIQTADKYVAHIELLPDRSSKVDEVLKRAVKRCEKVFGSEIANKLLFRLHIGTTSFQLTGSGKRNIQALIAEGCSQVLNG